MILLGALFGGAMYGGSISAILINTPGTPSAAATVLDGHPMANRGQAGEALREAVFASFLGGIFGVTMILFRATPVQDIFNVWTAGVFLLAVFGLTVIASVSEKSLIKGG